MYLKADELRESQWKGLYQDLLEVIAFYKRTIGRDPEADKTSFYMELRHLAYTARIQSELWSNPNAKVRE